MRHAHLPRADCLLANPPVCRTGQSERGQQRNCDAQHRHGIGDPERGRDGGRLHSAINTRRQLSAKNRRSARRRAPHRWRRRCAYQEILFLASGAAVDDVARVLAWPAGLVARVAGRDIMSWLHHRARPSRKSVTTSIAACLPVRSGFLPVSGGLTGPGGPEWRGAIHDGRRLPAPLGRPRPR